MVFDRASQEKRDKHFNAFFSKFVLLYIFKIHFKTLNFTKLLEILKIPSCTTVGQISGWLFCDKWQFYFSCLFFNFIEIWKMLTRSTAQHLLGSCDISCIGLEMDFCLSWFLTMISKWRGGQAQWDISKIILFFLKHQWI